MNFREQLSEAYKAGYNQGLQELQEGYHEGAHEEDEGYHEGAHEMDEKALAELGRMVMAGMHEGEHDEIEEAGHRNPFGVPDEAPDIKAARKLLKRLFGKGLGGAIGQGAFGSYSPLYGRMDPNKYYSGINTP